MIKLQSVSHYFTQKESAFVFAFKSKKVPALQDVNIEIKKDKLTLVTGPNGAGKSTLLRIVATLIKPTQGNVFVNDINIIKYPYKIKHKIGYTSGNERSFHYRLTGRENLDFFASLYNMPASQRKDRIKHVSSLVDLEHKLDHLYMSYSNGEKYRLSIARALLHQPKILLLDEPTLNLDKKNVQRLLSLLIELKNRNTTIILATNEPTKVLTIVDEVLVLKQGRIVKSNEQNIITKKSKECFNIKLITPKPLHINIIDDIKNKISLQDFHIIANPSFSTLTFNTTTPPSLVLAQIHFIIQKYNFQILQLNIKKKLLEDF